MGKLTAVLKLSSTALLVIMCAILLMLSLPQAGWKALTVQTGSMRPAIKPKTLVLVHRVPDNKLKVGDVITYINPANKKSTITHRIIAIQGRQITVKGDSNSVPDAPLTSSVVVGKVSYAIPHAGSIAGFVQKPLGLAALLIATIYLPALVIIAGEIQRLNKHYSKSQSYYLWPKRRSSKVNWAAATKLTVFLILASALIGLPVHAFLRSQASLTGNIISAARPITPPVQCTGNSNNTNVTVTGNSNSTNNVSVSNSSSQTASSGNTTNSGNTNGGSATSGNATNTNCTDIHITVTNH